MVGARAPMVKQSLSAAGKPTSDDISNQLFQLAACPTKREKCGARTVDLVSHRSQPVELKISDFTQDDTCTWYVRTECGLPTITVTDITKGIADHLEVSFIEYENEDDNIEDHFYDRNSDLEGGETFVYGHVPRTWMTASPEMYKNPERQNVGSLQSLKFKDPENQSVVDGSSLYSSLNSKRIAVSQYNDAA